jgi:hypothetical protein
LVIVALTKPVMAPTKAPSSAAVVVATSHPSPFSRTIVAIPPEREARDEPELYKANVS